VLPEGPEIIRCCFACYAGVSGVIEGRGESSSMVTVKEVFMERNLTYMRELTDRRRGQIERLVDQGEKITKNTISQGEGLFVSLPIMFAGRNCKGSDQLRWGRGGDSDGVGLPTLG